MGGRVMKIANVMSAAALVVGVLGFAGTPQAQEDFYKGRTVNMYIGFAPGGKAEFAHAFGKADRFGRSHVYLLLR